VRLVFALTTIGCTAALALDVWPGLANRLLFGFFLVCLTVPLICLCVLLLGSCWLIELLKKRTPPERRPWRLALATSAVALGTATALWFHTSRAIAFSGCAAELEAERPNAPVSEDGQPFDRRVGPYTVDKYATDTRGGVFFRTARGPDGIGPDEMSYGFVYQPNPSGTPFGNSSYELTHLFGDWYTFSVSDD
jgi:hypothetical protein